MGFVSYNIDNTTELGTNITLKYQSLIRLGLIHHDGEEEVKRIAISTPLVERRKEEREKVIERESLEPRGLGVRVGWRRRE